jgi:hypothetical protein
MAAEAVTFKLQNGTKVTCSKALAETLGHKPAPAKKVASSKPSDK